jgi:hypothetical protein
MVSKWRVSLSPCFHLSFIKNTQEEKLTSEYLALGGSKRPKGLAIFT